MPSSLPSFVVLAPLNARPARSKGFALFGVVWLGTAALGADDAPRVASVFAGVAAASGGACRKKPCVAMCRIFGASTCCRRGFGGGWAGDDFCVWEMRLGSRGLPVPCREVARSKRPSANRRRSRYGRIASPDFFAGVSACATSVFAGSPNSGLATTRGALRLARAFCRRSRSRPVVR